MNARVVREVIMMVVAILLTVVLIVHEGTPLWIEILANICFILYILTLACTRPGPVRSSEVNAIYTMALTCVIALVALIVGSENAAGLALILGTGSIVMITLPPDHDQTNSTPHRHV